MSTESGVTALAQAIGADIKLCARRVNPAIELTGSYTMSDADSGGSFIYNGSGSITVTFPASLSYGFCCKIENSGSGSVVFSAPSAVQFGNASRPSLIFQWDVVNVEIKLVAATRIIDLIYNLALPVLYAESSAALTRNTTAMTAIPALSIPLEANAAYDIDLIVSFTSAIITNTLKLGFAALGSGSKCAIEARVWNTLVVGTTPASHGLFMNSAQAVAGIAGTGSVLSTTLMARAFGRIRTGSSAFNLVATAGALTNTGNVSVAAGDATLSVSKVFDLGRT